MGQSNQQPKASLDDKSQAVELVLKMFDISDDSLMTIKSLINAEFELGLSDEENATIKMLITYVRELSRGDETGCYLALDLGGTHFRVLLVELNKGKAKITTAVHDIPHELLITQNGRDLFDYIALKLLEFVQQYRLKRRRISLGFTFSFPCKQYGLTQSVLVKWCKGFNVGGVIGTDVVKQLKDALKRQLAGLVEAYIDVVAVINDTTGTLVACANTNRECRIGLIVGTGYNACYMERLDKCEKWPANYTSPKQVIINCEWGAMGDNKERRELDKFRNEFDAQIDAESVNPKNQTYEKMVAGMYIGELLRLAMIKLYKSKLLFEKMAPNATSTANSKDTKVDSLTNKHSNLLNQSPINKDTLESERSASSRSKNSPKVSPSPDRSTMSQQSGSSIASSHAVGAASSPLTNSTSSSTDTSPTSSVNQGGHKLFMKDILNGKHISMIAKDEFSDSFEETVKVMQELDISGYSQQDLKIIVQLNSRIMTRSANLVAAGVSALIERVARPFTVIGYDGSVIRHHPYFLKKLTEKCAQLTGKRFKFEFMLSSDGSGIGAAVVAAALHKERRPLYVVKPGKLYELHFARNSTGQQSLLDTSDKKEDKSIPRK